MTTEYFPPTILERRTPVAPQVMAPAPVSTAPDLDRVLRTNHLPAGALVFGLADDGLPVALPLANRQISSVLIAGDDGCGKTALLQCVAASAVRLKNPERDLGIVVITSYPDEWPAMPAAHVRIFTPSDTILTMLAGIVDAGERPNTDMLVLVDSPRTILTLSDQSYRAYRTILEQGKQANMRLIMTAHTNELPVFADVLDDFRMRIYGQVRGSIRIPGNIPGGSELHALRHGQFTLRKSSRWLRFDTCAIPERM